MCILDVSWAYCIILLWRLELFQNKGDPHAGAFSFYSFVISVAALVVVSMVTTKTSEQVLDETMIGWCIWK
jgi:hypothetical protein